MIVQADFADRENPRVRHVLPDNGIHLLVIGFRFMRVYSLGAHIAGSYLVRSITRCRFSGATAIVMIRSTPTARDFSRVKSNSA